jgi:hypothetical protein
VLRRMLRVCRELLLSWRQQRWCAGTAVGEERRPGRPGGDGRIGTHTHIEREGGRKGDAALLEERVGKGADTLIRPLW